MEDQSVQPRVLLADDEILIRDLVQEALEEAGFAVEVAAAGDEAVESLRAAEGDFRALVTDINFGGEPTGWQVATLARELNPSMGVVYMTGDSAHEWTSQGVPLSTVVTKPFAPSQIVVALAALLNRTDADV